MNWCSIVLGLCVLAVTGQSAPVFTSVGREYHFDTGSVRGTLRAQGKSQGMTDVIHVASGTPVSRFMGCFSHYRLLDANAR